MHGVPVIAARTVQYRATNPVSVHRVAMFRARGSVVQAKARLRAVRHIPGTCGMERRRGDVDRQRQKGSSGSKAHRLWVAVAGIRPEQVQD